jgi:hypothetical protein
LPPARTRAAQRACDWRRGATRTPTRAHQAQLLLFLRLQRAHRLKQVCAAGVAQRGAQLVHLLGYLSERGGDLRARGVVRAHVAVREQGVEGAARRGRDVRVRCFTQVARRAHRLKSRNLSTRRCCAANRHASRSGTSAASAGGPASQPSGSATVMPCVASRLCAAKRDTTRSGRRI